MTFAVAAVGTGGHVFPALAVAEALVAAGVDRADVLTVGGDRLESTVFPDAGFPFLRAELAGLQRRPTLANVLANLRLPFVVVAAVFRLRKAFREAGVRVLLGAGGYVTVPAAIAARLAGAAVMVTEQNAHAGLGNRVAGWIARRRFGSFPETEGLDAEWVGNPVRAGLLGSVDRLAARSRYGIGPDGIVVGVFGGSLGAGVLNSAAGSLAAIDGVTVVHLAGARFLADWEAEASDDWRIVGFEDRMDLFYGACDLVVARAGGAVAELTATGTPSVLVPGGFGSSGHQDANARALERAGAAVVVPEDRVGELANVVADLVGDRDRLAAMAAATATLARPDAASVIAAAMIDAHG